jgi:hypothetical protein
MNAFVFEEDYTFKWPVTVRMPIDGGSFIEQTFTAVFAIVDENDLFDRQDVSSPGEAIEIEVKRFQELFLGFEGIFTDEDRQNELPSTPANVSMLLRRRHVRLGITQAYQDAVLKGELRTKN